MSTGPLITPQDQLHCRGHSEPIQFLYYKSSEPGNYESQFRCSKCDRDISKDIPLTADFASYEYNAFAISLHTDKLLLGETDHTDQPLNSFASRQLENMLITPKAQGFAPRNLAYMPDRHLLAACTKDGQIFMWKLGAQPKCLAHLILDKDGINFAKYIVVSEDKKLLVVGQNSSISVFNTSDLTLPYKTELTCDFEIRDCEYVEVINKLVCVGSGDHIAMWSVDNFEKAGTLEVTSLYKIRPPFSTAVYVKEKKQLAIEHEKGFSLLCFEDEDISKIKTYDYTVESKTHTGLKYLPEKQLFLMANTDFELVDAKTMTLKETVPSNIVKEGNESIDFKFILDKEENMFICNTPDKDFFASEFKNYVRVSSENSISVASALEVIPDQGKLIVADEKKGIILIYGPKVSASQYTPALSVSEVKPCIRQKTKERKKNGDRIYKQYRTYRSRNEVFVRIGEEDQDYIRVKIQKSRRKVSDGTEETQDGGPLDPNDTRPRLERRTVQMVRIKEKRRDEKRDNNMVIEEEGEEEEKKEDNKKDYYWVVIPGDDDIEAARTRRSQIKDLFSRGRMKVREQSESRERERSESKSLLPRRKTIAETIKGAKDIMKMINSTNYMIRLEKTKKKEKVVETTAVVVSEMVQEQA